MKKMLVIAVALVSLNVLADHHKGHEGHGKVHNVVVCKKECGAAENSHVKVESCANIRLMAGCYCGTHEVVEAQIKQCKKG